MVTWGSPMPGLSMFVMAFPTKKTGCLMLNFASFDQTKSMKILEARNI